ncbi:MAG: glycosyltransferase [Smithella sp.]|nr:glycosyltransferase [Smithella sp.]
MQNNLTFSVLILANDERVLHANILSSPDLTSDNGHEIIVLKNSRSAACGYNEGIAKASHDVLICVHQDVYLPRGWILKLSQIITLLEKKDPSWGVIGCFGVSVDGEMAGHVYSNGLQRELGRDDEPVLAQTLDEMILIIKKKTQLKFDPSLPNYHMYGADICVRAKMSGHSSYIIGNFCVHNSVSVRKLKNDFWDAVSHFRKQYPDHLPLKTTCTNLYKSALRMWLYVFSIRIREQLSLLRGIVAQPTFTSVRLKDPSVIRPRD